MKKSERRRINQYKNIIKGRLFEFIIEKFIQKSGFDTQIEIPQLTRTKKRLHGRGGTYAADFIGTYPLLIPFSYKPLLIGEAEYYKKKVDIKTVRSFLGAYIDVSQYPCVNTKSKNLLKYSQIFKEERHNYVPVIFSRKGFHKNAQALLYAHGINFISYENSPIFDEIEKKITTFLNKINYNNLNSDIIKSITNIDSFEDVPLEVKKDGYDKSLQNLVKVIDPVNSYFGYLDNIWTVNFLCKSKKKLKPSIKVRESLCELKGNILLIRKTKNEKSQLLGHITLPDKFIDEYKKESDKKDKNIFTDLTLYIPFENRIYPYYIKLTLIDQSK